MKEKLHFNVFILLMTLAITQGLFSQSQQAINVSLTLKPDSDAIRKLASSYGGTDGTFYINKRDSSYLQLKEFSGNQFKIKTKAKNWQIHSKEFKYIDKYRCVKATTVDTVVNPKGVFKFDVVAWFCPELPSFFGPAGYFGLAGLILELQNGKISLLAKEIDFEPANIPTFDISRKKGALVTQREFDSIVEKTAKDFFRISKF